MEAAMQCSRCNSEGPFYLVVLDEIIECGSYTFEPAAPDNGLVAFQVGSTIAEATGPMSPPPPVWRTWLRLSPPMR